MNSFQALACAVGGKESKMDKGYHEDAHENYIVAFLYERSTLLLDFIVYHLAMNHLQ
jgi:hypothetical protein